MPEQQQTQPDTKLDRELKRLIQVIEIQNGYNTKSQVILRGLMNGIFTALGATIGFAIVIIFLASFVRTISEIPVIDEILKQTRLDKIIEYQLQQIEKQEQKEEEEAEEAREQLNKTPVPTKESQDPNQTF